MNITADIIAYEDGELSFEETVNLFQHLLDTGLVWELQGHYGRMADHLIYEGHITPPVTYEQISLADFAPRDAHTERDR